MNIVAYVPTIDRSESSDFNAFVVETLFLLAGQHPEHTYILIAGGKLLSAFQNNVEVIVKPAPKNFLLKKIWRDVTLPATLKKLKAGLFISFDQGGLSSASIPQIIVVGEAGKVRRSDLRKSGLLIVNSETAKKQLTDLYGLSAETIKIIYPSAEQDYKTRNSEEKEKIRRDFSEDKEYFLYPGPIYKNEALVELLRSFSHFKKRQQSSYKLLLLTNANPFFEKTLSDYKYRTDVKFITRINKNDKAGIIAAAYGVILPFNTNEDQITALNAMQSGVPVIALKNSVVNEMAGDGALYAEKGDIKGFGEKMMQLYTDENYRSQLIKIGMAVTDKFNREKATELLWQAIVKTLG